MSTELQLSLRFSVHPGKRDPFEAAARECMEVTRSKDTGTLQYDWFFRAEADEYVVCERYRDSDAVLEHAANLGALVGTMLDLADAELEIHGEPSERLLGALAGLSVKVYAPFQSL